MSNNRILALVIGLALGWGDVESAAAQHITAYRTVSVVVSPGKHVLTAPACPLTGQRTRFHVTHVQGSPFVGRQGLPLLDGVRWAVKVYLRRTGDDERFVWLTAVGVGVVDVEAAVPSGQVLLDDTLTFSIDILDPRASPPPGEPNPFAALDFNVHISGFCRGP